ncbi:hypothetical protein C8R43DRAFT_869754, partial [Mycena crocata]
TCAMAAKSVTIRNDDPLIYFHGRRDSSPGTWWAGSGFKLNIKNLQSLVLNLGTHTTTPFAAVGVSLDYGESVTANVSAGSNTIPFPASFKTNHAKETVVRVNVEGWQNNRMNIESITLNPVYANIVLLSTHIPKSFIMQGATLAPYIPSKLVFQFIGDSPPCRRYSFYIAISTLQSI